MVGVVAACVSGRALVGHLERQKAAVVDGQVDRLVAGGVAGAGDDEAERRLTGAGGIDLLHCSLQ